MTINFGPQDTDGDGIPDYWEIDKFGVLTTANNTTDYDSDGLIDKDEYANKTDPKNSDSDNDDKTDGWEVANGFDPLDDILTIIVNGNGTVTSTDSRINCRSNCNDLYDEDTEVSWTAIADSGGS
ncbi:MAG: hypothetical protein SCABRO_02774 [Candidatus Scalindua brodae]|uniref:Uncharacterized protein n=1 Tax=Candidatus Scalindua brodae TaxID=237368 RepID=A0A0B0ELB3_9BACT|nr:MAG: hypothetical protein SCABRO_02774 [Candidatus Scalindua brodae]